MSIHLNSDPTYSSIGQWPVAQQLLGLSTILKNVIGAIKDIVIFIFPTLFCCGQTTEEVTNQQGDFNIVIQKVDEQITGYKARYSYNNDNLTHEAKVKEVNEIFQAIQNKIRELELKALPDDRESYYNNLYPAFCIQEQTFRELHIFKEQLENRKKELEELDKLNDLFEILPASERIQNIALGAVTALPVVGTIYHWALLKYYFTIDNSGAAKTSSLTV